MSKFSRSRRASRLTGVREPRRFNSGVSAKAGLYNSERLEKIEVTVPVQINAQLTPTAALICMSDATQIDAAVLPGGITVVYSLFARTRFTEYRALYSTYEVTGISMEYDPGFLTGTRNAIVLGAVIGGGTGVRPIIAANNYPTMSSVSNSYVSSSGSSNGQGTRCYLNKNRALVNGGTNRTCSTD